MSSKDTEMKDSPTTNNITSTTDMNDDHQIDSLVDQDGEGDGEGEVAELIYEDEGLRQEYEEARVWLENLSPSMLLKKSLFDDAEVAKLAETYKNNKPYPHLVIEDFIDADILDKVADEIRGLEWKAKNNDLYLFHQTKLDLKTARRPILKKLCQVLYCDEFVSILKKITGLPLFAVRSALEPQAPPPTVNEDGSVVEGPAPVSEDIANHPDFNHAHYSEPDMFAAVYGDTCRLLCHDDELEGRRIAYIIYLSKEWQGEWGGHLDLFDHEEIPSKTGKSYIPTTISKSYCPRFAQFAFFEVSETSFHQVREVYRQLEPGADENDETGQRFSVSGWYHGPHIVRQNDEYIPSSPAQIPPQNADKMKPVVSQVFNQSGFSQKEIDAKNAETIKALAESGSITIPARAAPVAKGAKKVAAPAIETKVQIEENIKFWVEKSYLVKATQKQVMQRFEEESCLDLVNFIKPSIYNQMLLECWQFEQKCFGPVDGANPTRPACDIAPILEKSVSPIESVGPCNLHTYYRYNPQNIINYIEQHPEAISALQNGKESLIYKFHQFLHSKSFFTVIGMFTGMKALSSTHELQLFRRGCYTLAHDNDPEAQSEGLDVTFSLWASDDVMKQFAAVGADGKPIATSATTDAVKKIDSAWEEGDYGGTIHYLQAGEDDELLTVSSPSNTLSLVYRAGDDKIFQFQRYLNHTAPGSLYRFRGMMKLDD